MYSSSSSYGINSFTLYSRDNRNIILYPGSGNVGIGTNNPQAKLEVNGVIRLTPQTSAPTPVIGGMYYNQNDKTFYCGLPDRAGNPEWRICGGWGATTSPPQGQELIIPVKIWSDQNKTRLVLEITEE